MSTTVKSGPGRDTITAPSGRSIDSARVGVSAIWTVCAVSDSSRAPADRRLASANA